MDHSRVNRLLFVIQLALTVAVVLYGYRVYLSFDGRLFNPGFTSGDAQQQLFPFYDAVNPELFRGDLPYEAMKAYLPPLHYWLGIGITKFTHNPVLTGHWIMVIQYGLTALFVYLAVLKGAGNIPALFALLWMLHSRFLIGALGSGLPRAWFGPILSLYLLTVLTQRHRATIATLCIAPLLNPVAAFLASLSYGLTLTWQMASSGINSAAANNLFRFALFAPLIVILAYAAVRRPPEIGSMHSYQQASAMEAFSRVQGRFPLIPLREPLDEIAPRAFRVFTGASVKTGTSAGLIAALVVAATLLAITVVFIGWRKNLLPAELSIFLVAIFAAYWLARCFAFQLYIPGRYLAWPPAIWGLVATPIVLWRVFGRASALVLFALLIYTVTGDVYSNIKPPLSFRSQADVPLYVWLRRKTPIGSVVAGHPLSIDGVQLFGVRRGYITMETAHPFHDAYFAEASRRIELSLRAFYSKDANQFVETIGKEKVDYFVFLHSAFESDAAVGSSSIKPINLFNPFNRMIAELASAPVDTYWYSELKRGKFKQPFVVFENRAYAVVSLQKLKEWIGELHQSRVEYQTSEKQRQVN